MSSDRRGGGNKHSKGSSAVKSSRRPHRQSALPSDDSPPNTRMYDRDGNDDMPLLVSKVDESSLYGHSRQSQPSSSRYKHDDHHEYRRTPSPPRMPEYTYSAMQANRERERQNSERDAWRDAETQRSSQRPTNDSYYSRPEDEYYRTSERPSASERYYDRPADFWPPRTSSRYTPDADDRQWRSRSSPKQSSYDAWAEEDRYAPPRSTGDRWESRQDTYYDDRYSRDTRLTNGSSWPADNRVADSGYSRGSQYERWDDREDQRPRASNDDRAWQPAPTWNEAPSPSRDDKAQPRTTSQKKSKKKKKKDREPEKDRERDRERDKPKDRRRAEPENDVNYNGYYRSQNDTERSSTKRRRSSVSRSPFRSMSRSPRRSRSPTSPANRKRRRTRSPVVYASPRDVAYTPMDEDRGRSRSRTPFSASSDRYRREGLETSRPRRLSTISISRSPSRSPSPVDRRSPSRPVHRLNGKLPILPPAGPRAGVDAAEPLEDSSRSTPVRTIPSGPRQLQSAIDAPVDPRLPKGPRISGIPSKATASGKAIVASNSVRRFFPGDDDEFEGAAHSSAPSPATRQVPLRPSDIPKGPSFLARNSPAFVPSESPGLPVDRQDRRYEDDRLPTHEHVAQARPKAEPMDRRDRDFDDERRAPVDRHDRYYRDDRAPHTFQRSTASGRGGEELVIGGSAMLDARDGQPVDQLPAISISVSDDTPDNRTPRFVDESPRPRPERQPENHMRVPHSRGVPEEKRPVQEARPRTTSASVGMPPAGARPPEPVDVYHTISQVGEGTFGKVYKAQNTMSGVYVALKRIRMEQEKDGFPVTAMREIKLLQSLRHPNVVRLYEMMVSKGSVYMVFEYMDHDLTGVLTQNQFPFSAANLKSFCAQLLRGLSYLHHKGVIHRDIKGSNILISNQGELKLADFGLARFYHKRRRMDYTNRVITLWYRPPELVLGATEYGPEVDMWSAGCIMLELFTRKPIFQGNDEIHQLECIFRIMGTPIPDDWQGGADLPWYELIKPKGQMRSHFRESFSRWLSPDALDLAGRLLTYDPLKRITAADALEHAYFTTEEPAPEQPYGMFGVEGEWHEFESKREREKERAKQKRRKPDAAPSEAEHVSA